MSADETELLKLSAIFSTYNVAPYNWAGKKATAGFLHENFVYASKLCSAIESKHLSEVQFKLKFDAFSTDFAIKLKAHRVMINFIVSERSILTVSLHRIQMLSASKAKLKTLKKTD